MLTKQETLVLRQPDLIKLSLLDRLAIDFLPFDLGQLVGKRWVKYVCSSLVNSGEENM